MKHLEIIIAPLLGSLLAIIFARPKSILDALGRLGIGIFAGVYFTPLIGTYIQVQNEEIISGIAAGFGLFGFFMVEAVIRMLRNLNNFKDIK